MPHDKNGKLLREGDEVFLRCKVTQIQPSMEYCNLNLVTVEPMFPSTTPFTLTANAKQVELIRGFEDLDSDRDTENAPR